MSSDPVRPSPFARLGASGRGRIRPITQLTASDCGAACLAMVLGYHGRATSIEAARSVLGGTPQGVTARQLAEAARRFGLRCRGVKLDLPSLAYAPRGTILHWEMNHFVVLESVDRRGARIVDPASGPRRIALKDLAERCTGVALLSEPGEQFVVVDEPRKPFTRYLRWLRAAPGYWSRVIALSIVLQLSALAAPALVGLTIDKVLPRHDGDLLQLLGIAALVALSVQLLTSYVRSNLLLHLRTYMDAQMTLDLNEHLLSLPFGFFQQRSAGDLVMRLGSGAQIRDVLTSSALSAVLDGSMALVYFALLVIVAPLLAAIACAVAISQSSVVLASGRRNAELMAEQLVAQARLASVQVDALAAIEPIKSMGAEARIAERWSDLYVDVLNGALDRGRLGATVTALTGALGFAGPLAMLLTGAHLVMNGSLGTGGMLALSALGSAFLTPVGALVSMWTQLQTLKSYVRRVEDILDTEPEKLLPLTAADEAPAKLSGAIELRDVTFAYAEHAAPVIERISLEVAPGEFLAVVGASGSGKSTLARLLAGLFAPRSGSVQFDRIDAQQWDPKRLRGMLGMVTQDTRLMATTIRENVSLYDASVPLDRIEAAARLAEIHDDVTKLPLGYDTVLSDGGGSLSGGQRQRLALARALLRTPAVLVLDEATSALDSVTEQRVQEHLRDLRCTRIVIAHRLSTVRAADRIVVLDRGRVVDVGRHSQLLARCPLYRELVSAQSGLPAIDQAKAG
ncbi:MAG TPA: peptidase domain-containing ABC transporter [Polyangiales bacterium]|jgi:ABC-type bacteriocin/lantibiotic exporter with double-glycine peptidase domain